MKSKSCYRKAKLVRESTEKSRPERNCTSHVGAAIQRWFHSPSCFNYELQCSKKTLPGSLCTIALVKPYVLVYTSATTSPAGTHLQELTVPSLRYLIWVACLFLASSSFGQKEDWLPVTPQDQQIKEVLGDEGGDAIQLYYADYINDNDHSEFYYHRIKVLTEKAKQSGGTAEVEILLPLGMSMSDFKARTIRPDGQIVEFAGKPFEKTVVKGRGFKFLAKTFTFPDVTVGSILEYKYKLHGDEDTINTRNSWTIQHNLFTVQEHFIFKANGLGLADVSGGTNVSYLTLHLSRNPTMKNGTVELSMENVPAFQGESNMPPEENYKPQVRFFYGGSETKSPEKFWQERGKRRYEAVNHFIGNHNEIKDAAIAAIGSETAPDKQLVKLYERLQQIRNLTYERDRSEEERKKEQLKPNENVGDVLKRGYGDRVDITLLFAAMARALGMDASVLYVSSRLERFFNSKVMDASQLDSMMAMVKVNGKDIYLDPGTRFCPYGMVRWFRTSTAALKPEKDGGTFLEMPSLSYDKDVIYRLADMVLTQDGSLKGSIIVKYTGADALEHRLDALNTDEAGRKKALEDELKGWISSGTIVKIAEVQGMQAVNEPLIARFDVELPGYASAAGKRLLLASYLFQARKKDAFKHPERKYPVYFPYAFAEVDKIGIRLPAGYSVEGAPQPQEAGVPYARYSNTIQFP